MLKPPPDFRTNFDSTPPPILIDSGKAILENDIIERYIMKNIPGGYNLFVMDKETAKVIENLYSVSGMVSITCLRGNLKPACRFVLGFKGNTFARLTNPGFLLSFFTCRNSSLC